MNSLIYFFVGIGLSMDAFSLSLSIGTTSPSKKNIIKTSIIVGIFHFIMPLLGYFIGNIFKYKIIGINILTFLIFIILAFEMYKNKDEENKSILNNLTILLIALSVSIDSLTVGIAFGLNSEFIIISSIIFSLTSSFFTYIGFNLGKDLEYKYKNKATYLGIILLIIVALKYLLNV
ncbi:MAG: manganese efflux pump [Bacilli bacterium]|nr:manganese efflux pump [Bacilli bacterium]